MKSGTRDRTLAKVPGIVSPQPQIYQIPSLNERSAAMQPARLSTTFDQIRQYPSAVYQDSRYGNNSPGSSISIANIPGQQLSISSTPGGSHTIIHVPPPSQRNLMFPQAFTPDPTLAALRQIQAAQLQSLPLTKLQALSSGVTNNPNVPATTMLSDTKVIEIKICFCVLNCISLYFNRYTMVNRSLHS